MDANPFIVIFGILAFLVLLFAPTVMAFVRASADRVAILGLNLLFFYSIIVWVALLMWSITGSRHESLLARLQTDGKAKWVAPIILLSVIISAALAMLFELPRLFLRN
jgi:hypothetical protein